MSPILLKIFVEAVAGTFKVQDYASIKIEKKNGSETKEYEFKVVAAATEEAEKEEDSAGNQDEN